MIERLGYLAISLWLACFVASLSEQSPEANNEHSRWPLDLAVSGAGKSAALEKSNKVSRWLTRLVKSDDYFEIPNYPLDQQPDPDQVTHIDSDLRSCTSEIKDQKACGACYAFSWLAFAEWHYCMQTRGEKRIDFSEQHIIDCGHKARLDGCRSGFLPDTFDFSQLFGLHLEEQYPYSGRKSATCKREMGSHEVIIDAERVNFDRAEWESILNEQPILVQVSLPADISSYSRGIHPGNNCDKQRSHGMLLVGHGRQEGRPYWLLKNSMGREWGENGYLRLSREAPAECMKTGFVAKLKFGQLDEDLYYEFYESLSHQPSTSPIYDKKALWKSVTS